MKLEQVESLKAEHPTDQEINELAEWLNEHTARELLFFKHICERYLAFRELAERDLNVH